jgi:hypothetical protein
MVKELALKTRAGFHGRSRISRDPPRYSPFFRSMVKSCPRKPRQVSTGGPVPLPTHRGNVPSFLLDGKRTARENLGGFPRAVPYLSRLSEGLPLLSLFGQNRPSKTSAGFHGRSRISRDPPRYLPFFRSVVRNCPRKPRDSRGNSPLFARW